MLNKTERVPTEKIDTLIGPETNVWGRIVCYGTLRIDGWASGEILTKKDVIIGESGVVSAKIKARNIIVAGKLKGDIIYEGCVE
jgi:cytoskeletal protein CcmA (bactofilin family)